MGRTFHRRAGFSLVTALLAVAGCSGEDPGPMVPRAAAEAVAVAPTPSEAPTVPADVPYVQYRETAQLLSIRPDLMATEDGFADGLRALCARDAEAFADLARQHRVDAGESADGSSAYRYLAEETALRVDLACPRRMSDWLAARDNVESTEESWSGGEAMTAAPEPTEGGAAADSAADDGTAPGQGAEETVAAEVPAGVGSSERTAARP